MGILSGLSNWFSGSSKITSLNYIGNEVDECFNPYYQGYGIDKGYASNTDVFAIINMIKSKAIDVPLLLEKVVGDEVEPVESGEIFDFFHNPNKNKSLKEFNEALVLYYLTTGNSMVETKRMFTQSGKIIEAMNLHYQNTEIETMVEGRLIVPKYYKYQVNGKEDIILPENMIHSKYMNPTDFGFESCYGLSPLQAGFLTLISSNNLFKADASILKNKGASGVFSNESDVVLTPDQRKNAQSALDKLLAGADKFGKIIQSPVKTKYTQLGMSPADLKILESRIMKKRDLCSIYHVDSSLFNDPANKTFNNRKEAQKSLYTDAVLPLINKVVIDKVWNPILSTWGDESTKYRVKADKSDIDALHQDAKEKSTRDKAVSNIIINTLTAEISDEQKIKALQVSLNITEDEAQNIVIP
jgi:HK97 family phage portal protein